MQRRFWVCICGMGDRGGRAGRAACVARPWALLGVWGLRQPWLAYPSSMPPFVGFIERGGSSGGFRTGFGRGLDGKCYGGGRLGGAMMF